MEAQKNSFRHDTLAGKINSLLSYANARYRDLYEKADDQQLRGKVSKSKRGSESFDLNVPDEKKSICKLAIYTFTYATRDDKAYLKDRGEHYWKNRSVQNICDNGWDVKEELLLVMFEYIDFVIGLNTNMKADRSPFDGRLLCISSAAFSLILLD